MHHDPECCSSLYVMYFEKLTRLVTYRRYSEEEESEYGFVV